LSENRVLVVLAAAAGLGILGATPAAAGDQTRWFDRGGFVKPCSLEGVNPVFHPGIFSNRAVAKSYGFVKSRGGTWHVMNNCHIY
jgi:hypothetical protein